MKSTSSEDLVSAVIRKLGSDYASLRHQKNLTQKEVAKKSGLSVFTISTFESGSLVGLTMSTYIKLLQAIESKEMIERLYADKNDKAIEL